MSTIHDLIAKHCPDGVEYKPLGDVGRFTRGNGLQKKDLTDEGVPAIHYGQVFTHYGTLARETKAFVSAEVAARLRKAVPGNLVIATTSENDEDVCKAVAWLGEADAAVSGDAYIYAHNLDPKYASYLFQTTAFQVQKSRFVTGTKVRRVGGRDLASIKVPVPPHAVQREIASILEKMEQLETELRAEYTARRDQYIHYRDLLISAAWAGDPEGVAFGESARIVRGGSPRPIQDYLIDAAEDGINWIKIGDVPADGKYITSTRQRIRVEGEGRSRSVQPGDFILSNSMSFGRPYILQIDGCIHDGWLAIQDFTAHYDANFLYHLLRSTPVQRTMEASAGAGTVRNLNADIVKRLRLPRPALRQQQETAGMLDAFDAIVNDPRSGIRAEIAARRKQYEYYRDLLLTFPEKTA